MITQLTGDCRVLLPTLKPGSVQCVATSPPYWNLRDYGLPSLVWGDGWVGSLGLERSVESYIAHLVECFSHVKRVLRDDGCMWVNLGDSYNNRAVSRPSSHQAGLGFHNASTDTSWREHSANGRTRLSLTGGGLKEKDLMMIPFRVAMALQQPYVEPCCVKRDVDRAWLAAMFDGEGTIGIRRYNSYREEKRQVYQDGFVAYTSVTNSDVVLLDRCIEITRYGRAMIKWGGQAGTVDKRGVITRRDSYGWRHDGNAAIDIIRAIYPYLIAKRKQAMIAYTLDQINKGARADRGNNPVAADVQAKKVLLHDLIKRCNQREEVDLPDWLEEPKPKVEPGWYLRSVIPWIKRNSMPESVTDRPSTAVEYIFLLAKSGRYFWDAEAVRMSQRVDSGWLKSGPGAVYNDVHNHNGQGASTLAHLNVAGGRNLRNADFFFQTWQGLLLDEEDDPLSFVVNPAPFSGAHFATFSPKLVEPMIRAGTSQRGECPECGAPWTRVVETGELTPLRGNSTAGPKARNQPLDGLESKQAHYERDGWTPGVRDASTTGWRPSCAHTAEPRPQTVLDLFSGAGTVGLVADRLGRNVVLIDLKPSYAEMGSERIRSDAPLFAQIETEAAD